MTELEDKWTSQFKKNYKTALKRNFYIELLNDVIRALQERKHRLKI